MEKIIEKLNKDVSEQFKPVSDHLVNLTVQDPVFFEKVLNENKTMKECFEYIMFEARKKAENNVAVVPKEEVFGWSVHYFDEEDLGEFTKKKQKQEEERKKILEENKIIEENRKKQEKANERRKVREEKPDEEMIKQLEKKQEEDKFKKENKAAEEQIMLEF